MVNYKELSLKIATEAMKGLRSAKYDLDRLKRELPDEIELLIFLHSFIKKENLFLELQLTSDFASQLNNPLTSGKAIALKFTESGELIYNIYNTDVWIGKQNTVRVSKNEFTKALFLLNEHFSGEKGVVGGRFRNNLYGNIKVDDIIKDKTLMQRILFIFGYDYGVYMKELQLNDYSEIIRLDIWGK